MSIQNEHNKERTFRLDDVLFDMEIVDSEYWNYKKLVSKIPLSHDTSITNTFIDWEKVAGREKVPYSYEGSKEDINRLFKESALSNKEKICMTLGPRHPIIAMPVSDFLEWWEDLVDVAMDRCIAWSYGDEELFMEFSYYHQHALLTNFEILKGWEFPKFAGWTD